MDLGIAHGAADLVGVAAVEPALGCPTNKAADLLHVAVQNQQFGRSLDEAFAESRNMQGNKNRTLDNTAVAAIHLTPGTCGAGFAAEPQGAGAPVEVARIMDIKAHCLDFNWEAVRRYRELDRRRPGAKWRRRR